MDVHSKPRVVVITGGSAGVGRATARRFAAAGCSVAILARGKSGIAATVSELQVAGVAAAGLAVDVADAELLEAAAAEVELELGPIDIWINNAMTTVFGRFMDISAEEYRRVTDVTYHGVANGTRAALRRMIPRNRGTIIQVSSALAYRAIPLQTAYCGSKHAVRALTEGIRAELLHDQIDVHLGMVHLPGMNTPQFRWCRTKMAQKSQPVPPIFQPEIAADAIFYAAVHRRRDLQVGLPTLKTILGEKVAPGLLDHVLANEAVSGQQLAESEPPVPRPDNLFEPVEGDVGARGVFTARARERDLFTEATKFFGPAGTRALLAAAVASSLVAFGYLRGRRG